MVGWRAVSHLAKRRAKAPLAPQPRPGSRWCSLLQVTLESVSTSVSDERLKRASCLATRTACSRSPPSLVRRTRRLPLAACACTAARRPPGLSKSKQLAEPPQEFLLRPGRSSVPTRSTHCAVLACTAPTGKIHTPCVEKAGQITGRRFQAQPTPNRPLQRLSKTHPTASRISAQVRETKDGGVASGAGRRDAGAGREGW